MRFPPRPLRRAFVALCAAAVAVVALGASTAGASQTVSTVLTGATSGTIVGFNHASGRLIAETGNGGTVNLQTRSPAGVLVKSVPLGANAEPTALGNGVVAVVFGGSGTTSRQHVEIFSATTLALVANVSLGFIPQNGVAVAGGQVWLIDPHTGVLESFPVSGTHTLKTYPGVLPNGINFSIIGGSDGAATVYVEEGGTQQMLAVHASSTPAVTGTISGSRSQFAVSGDGSLLAMPRGTGGVLLMSPTTLATVRTLSVVSPASAGVVSLSYDGSRVSFSDPSYGVWSAAYEVLDSATGEVLYTEQPEAGGTELADQPLTFTSNSGLAEITRVTFQDAHPSFMAFSVPATPTYWTQFLTPQGTGGGLNSPETFTDRLVGSPQTDLGHQQIDVTLTPPVGTAITDSVSTASDGTFTYTAPAFTRTGVWKLTFGFAGGGGYQAASVSQNETVLGTADKLALTSTVTKSLVYNKSLSLTATLAPFQPGAEITIWKTVVGVKTAIYTGPVGSAGSVTLSQTPHLSTTYSATFAGDDTYNPSTAKAISIAVLPILKGAWPGGYGTSSGYRLFHYQAGCVKTHNAGCPQFTITATPNLKNRMVYLVIQQKSGSSWKSVYSAHHLLGAASKVTLPLPYASNAVIGHLYRIAIVYQGDKVGHGAVTWGYWGFRVTS